MDKLMYNIMQLDVIAFISGQGMLVFILSTNKIGFLTFF